MSMDRWRLEICCDYWNNGIGVEISSILNQLENGKDLNEVAGSEWRLKLSLKT